MCECSKGYNRICKVIWILWKFLIGLGSGEIGMYFLILLYKFVVYVFNYILRKMIVKICLDNIIEMYLKIYIVLKI